jgi:hypothetical protein
VLDRFTARWLGTPINTRNPPPPDTVQKKLDEMRRLEAFFDSTG